MGIMSWIRGRRAHGPETPNLDRHGARRLAGYKRHQSRLCPECYPEEPELVDGVVPPEYRVENTDCGVCGGYGEVVC